jgi:DNA-binding XRE family transcriptional regulator
MKLNAQKVREARLAAGISVQDAALQLEASRTTLFNTEAGRSLPSPNLLGRMATLYGVGVQDFFDVPEPVGCGANHDEEG